MVFIYDFFEDFWVKNKLKFQSIFYESLVQFIMKYKILQLPPPPQAPKISTPKLKVKKVKKVTFPESFRPSLKRAEQTEIQL